MSGLRTTNLDPLVLLDEVIGNREGSTGRIPAARLAHQMSLDAIVVNKQTRADLYADLAWDEETRGAVWGDANEALRGVYIKSGAPGAGAWTRIGDLPQTALTQAQLAGKVDTGVGHLTVNSGAYSPLRPLARWDSVSGALVTSPPNVALNAVLLGVVVHGADPAMHYRVPYIQNGNTLGTHTGYGVIIQEARRTDYEATGIAANIVYPDGTHPDFDPDGGVQTLSFYPPLRPDVRIDVTIDADKLPPTGTPINAYADAGRDGWSWVVDRTGLGAADILIRHSQLPRPLGLSWYVSSNILHVIWASGSIWIMQRWGLNGINQLPNFMGLLRAPRLGQIAPVWETVVSAGTDWLPPLQFRAAAGGDGGSAVYTGGNHGSDGGAGGVPTAQSLVWSVMVDGAPIQIANGNSGFGSTIGMHIVNDVYAYNTITAARVAARQHFHAALFAGGAAFESEVRFLERAYISADNGPQLTTLGGYTSQLILGGQTDREPLNTYTSSGRRDLYPEAWALVLQGPDLQMVSWVDRDYEAGDGRYVAPSQSFVRGGGANLKFYHAIVFTETEFQTGESYRWRGGYAWQVAGLEPADLDSIFTIRRGGTEQIISVSDNTFWTVTPDLSAAPRRVSTALTAINDTLADLADANAGIVTRLDAVEIATVLGIPDYPDVPTGIAGVGDGQIFMVTSAGIVTLYRRDDDAAVVASRIATEAMVQINPLPFTSLTAYAAATMHPDRKTASIMVAGRQYEYQTAPLVVTNPCAWSANGVPIVPAEAAHAAHWGVVPDDPSDPVENAVRWNRGMAYCVSNRIWVLRHADGVHHFAETLNWDRRVRVIGEGPPPNVRTSPVSLSEDNSTPASMFINEGGTAFRFSGSAERVHHIDHISKGHQNGYGRAMPKRPWNNAYDARVDLLDLTNGDAVGATPATLRAFNTAVFCTGDPRYPPMWDDVRIELACDGVTAGGGTGMAGYQIANAAPEAADYDFGMLMESPWQSTIKGLHIYGYWGLRALLITTFFRDNPFAGYAEGNQFTRAFFHGGVAIRAGDSWPVLRKTESTITVPWADGHRFGPAGTLRVGEGFVSYVTLTYAGVSYDAGAQELTLTITGGDLASVVTVENGVGGYNRRPHHVVTTGGAGPALTNFGQGSQFYGYDHTSLVPEPGLGLPYRAALEISGVATRAIQFEGSYFHPCSLITVLLGYAPDTRFNFCYTESRRWRLAFGGALQNRGAAWIAGPEGAKLNLAGETFNGSIYFEGYTLHTSVNMAPKLRVSTSGWWGDQPYADFWNPRSTKLPMAANSRTGNDTAIVGLRGETVTGAGRRVDGSYYTGWRINPVTGSVLLGRNLFDVGGEDDPVLEEYWQLLLQVGQPAVLRNNLHLTDSVSTTIKDFRNDNNNLSSQDAPTGNGLRFVGSISQLRLARSDGPALQVHRPASGAVVDLRRAGVSVGGFGVYAGRAQLHLTNGVGGVIVTAGTGSPEGNIAGDPGSEYTRHDGDGVTIPLKYEKRTGSGTTGWLAIKTEAFA